MRLSLHRVGRILRNAALDLRYGGFLGGHATTRFQHLGAHPATNTDYGVLPQLFDGLVGAEDVLVDVGCGRGRVLNWWLARGLRNTMYGLELDPAIAAHTAHRLRRHHNVRIIAGDAVAHLPREGTIFYLFNPFDAPVLERFRDAVAALDHPVTVVYFAPVHLEVFARPGWDMSVRELALPAGGTFDARHHSAAIVRGPSA